MEEPLDANIHTRVPGSLRQELDEQAAELGLPPWVVARRLIQEGLRRERCPGIVFRDGASGRRAAITGRRLDVWQVMETLWASGGDVGEAADYLQLKPEQVEAAAAYYGAYPDEIDERVRRNRDEAERLLDAQDRQQAALHR